MVRACWRLARFFAHESCGQCTPCREGTHWLEVILERILHGKGRSSDIDLIVGVAGNIGGNSLCALGDAAAMGVGPIVQKFRDEILAEMAAAAPSHAGHAAPAGNGRLSVLQGA